MVINSCPFLEHQKEPPYRAGTVLKRKRVSLFAPFGLMGKLSLSTFAKGAAFGLLILLLGTSACSTGNGDTSTPSDSSKDSLSSSNPEKASEAPEPGSFEAYIASLDTLSLPFRDSSHENPEGISDEYAEKAFEEHGMERAMKPLGILFRTDSNIVTIELSLGASNWVPFIVSYGPDGKKLDSLAPYRESGRGKGYLGYESLIVREGGKFTVRDSIRRWESDENGEPIDSTLSVRQDTTHYRLTGKGKILEGSEELL
ncbi:MAG: hypothetical protein ABEH38_05390 [Flavobacteriales bacterium]